MRSTECSAKETINIHNSGHLIFSRNYVHSAPQKVPYLCFFDRTPKISRINEYLHKNCG